MKRNSHVARACANANASRVQRLACDNSGARARFSASLSIFTCPHRKQETSKRNVTPRRVPLYSRSFLETDAIVPVAYTKPRAPRINKLWTVSRVVRLVRRRFLSSVTRHYIGITKFYTTSRRVCWFAPDTSSREAPRLRVVRERRLKLLYFSLYLRGSIVNEQVIFSR